MLWRTPRIVDGDTSFVTISRAGGRNAADAGWAALFYVPAADSPAAESTSAGSLKPAHPASGRNVTEAEGSGYRRDGRSAESLLELTTNSGVHGRELTIASNRVAGCALWSWVWNGVEYVNDHDYGRQIQTAFVSDGGTRHEANPTEAGSQWSTSIDPAYRQGSVCLTAANTAPSTQVTEAIPLEWRVARWGGDSIHPIMWKDVRLGKEITLDFLGLGAVARYTSVVKVPTDVPGAAVEIPTAYLDARLHRFYGYDAASRILTLLAGGEAPFVPGSGYGGLIAASGDSARAFGQYGVMATAGGSVSSPEGFRFFFFPAADAGSRSADATSKIRAEHRGLLRGENRFTTYLMTADLHGVTELMDSLYAHRSVAK